MTIYEKIVYRVRFVGFIVLFHAYAFLGVVAICVGIEANSSTIGVGILAVVAAANPLAFLLLRVHQSNSPVLLLVAGLVFSLFASVRVVSGQTDLEWTTLWLAATGLVATVVGQVLDMLPGAKPAQWLWEKYPQGTGVDTIPRQKAMYATAQAEPPAMISHTGPKAIP